MNFVDDTEVVSPASDDVTMMSSSAANTIIPTREHPFLARLVSNERVTPATHFQDVRLVTFDVEGSGIRYRTDHSIIDLPPISKILGTLGMRLI